MDGYPSDEFYYWARVTVTPKLFNSTWQMYSGFVIGDDPAIHSYDDILGVPFFEWILENGADCEYMVSFRSFTFWFKEPEQATAFKIRWM